MSMKCMEFLSVEFKVGVGLSLFSVEENLKRNLCVCDVIIGSSNFWYGDLPT